METPTYTEDQYKRFVESVHDAESRDQLRRIRARVEQPKLIAEFGKETCDAMFARLTRKPPAHDR